MNAQTASLLKYEINSAPNPLKPEVAGMLNLNISSLQPSVICSKITLNIPFGPDQTDIFAEEPTGKLITASGWTLASPVIVQQPVNMGVFTLSNTNPGNIIPAALSLEISGKVNALQGTTSLTITDNAGTNPTSQPNNSTTLGVNKGSESLFLINFVAARSTAPHIPITEFMSEEKIVLSWHSNGSNYEIFQAGQTTPVYNDSLTTFTLATGLTRDTTFILKASGKTQGLDETLYLPLTLTVSNPTLTPDNVTIGVAGSKNPAFTIKGGSTSITGNEFTVNAPASFVQNLNAGGLISKGALIGAKGLAPGSMVTVGGQTDIQGPLNVSGAASFNGTLKATGIVSTVLKPKVVYLLNSAPLGKPVATNLTVSSDGFFLFQMSNGGKPAGSSSQLYAQVIYPGSSTPVIFNSYCATGQTTYQTIPVSAGTKFHLLATFFHVAGSVIWLGSTAPTKIAAQALENSQLPAEVVTFQKQIESLQAVPTEKEAYARSFVEELQVQFDKELSQEATDLLVTKLLNIERGG